MACPVGLSWRAACAAVRAGIDRKQPTPFLSDDSEPIIGSWLAQLDLKWTAQQRWLFLLSQSLVDALGNELASLTDTALIVAITDAVSGISSDALARELSNRLQVSINPRRVRVIARGAYGGYSAIAEARALLEGGRTANCIVAAADSLIGARQLLALAEANRLLTSRNSDGLIPGEAAVCLWLTRHSAESVGVLSGLGFDREMSTRSNDVPLKSSGCLRAAREALAQAALEPHQIDFRVSDAAGESFDFKEQMLLVARLLRQRKLTFPLWLCAESIGYTGAAAGLCGLATVLAGFARGYAPGRRAMAFAGNETGERAVVIIERS